MIRITLADDHTVVRSGLKLVIGECSDLEVVGEAATGDELLAMLRERPVDVVVLDISMPGPGLLEMLRRITQCRPAPKVLILSTHPEEQYALRALQAGADGYLTKDNSAEELAHAIRRVHRTGKYISDSLATRIALEAFEPSGEQPPHAALSRREFQILQLIGAGRSVKEIGEELHLSPKTVSTYRARILEKMGLESTASIIRYAVQAGLVE